MPNAAHDNIDDAQPLKQFLLRLKTLNFISAVDSPAQEPAVAVLIKGQRGAELEVASKFCPVVKVSEELGLVFGWAMVNSRKGEDYFDLQGDHIDDVSMMAAAADFMSRSRAQDAMHDGRKDGEVVFCMPMTPDVAKAFGVSTETFGLMIAVKPSPEVLAKFKDGSYRGFSIEGIGEREPRQKRDVAKLDKEQILAALNADQRLRAAVLADLDDEAEDDDASDVGAEAERMAQRAEDKATGKRADDDLYQDILKTYAHARDYVARNGESDWVRQHVVQGWGPFLKQQRAEAEAVAKASGAEAEQLQLQKAAADASAEYSELVRKKGGDSLALTHPVTGDRLVRDAYDRLQKARADEAAGPRNNVVKAAEHTIAKQQPVLDEMVENFSVAHNLDEGAARLRLLDISPTARKMHEDITGARRTLETEQHRARAQGDARNRAQRGGEVGGEPEAKRAPVGPAVTEFSRRVAAVVKAGKMTEAEATLAVGETDPDLWDAVRDERAAERRW